MEKWTDWLMLLVPRSVLCQLSAAATYFRCTALDIVFYLMTRPCLTDSFEKYNTSLIQRRQSGVFSQASVLARYSFR